jgi:hypothetical protein
VGNSSSNQLQLEAIQIGQRIFFGIRPSLEQVMAMAQRETVLKKGHKIKMAKVLETL